MRLIKKPEDGLRVRGIARHSCLAARRRNSGIFFHLDFHHRLWHFTRSTLYQMVQGSRALVPGAIGCAGIRLCVIPGAIGCAGIRLCVTAGQEFLPASGRSLGPED